MSKIDKLVSDIKGTLMEDGAIAPVGVACVTLFSVGAMVRMSRSLKRDAHGGTFGDFLTGGLNILSNKDSVLKRSEVEESVSGYENLFSGARKDVGSTSTDDSIKKREKEYKTMVNSFYNLVTDFYEWGWGQVSFNAVFIVVCDAVAFFGPPSVC